MNVVLLGIVSALDVLANVFIFSGALRPDFDVAEAADFSTTLGWAVVLAAVGFGGFEQLVDHKKVLPDALVSHYAAATLVLLAAGVVALTIMGGGYGVHVGAATVLAAVLGARAVARSIAYARGRYRSESVVSILELGLLVGLTVAEFSILAAYSYSKAAGVVSRLPLFAGFPRARIDRAQMWSYSFAAVAPALYFNVYYAALPIFAGPEVVVRFRLLQSLLVPASFLGSLFARARIIFSAKPHSLLRVFDAPRRTQSLGAFSAAALLPAVAALIYIVAIGRLMEPLTASEIACMTLYCAFIYHRAQLYSHLTLRLGPAVRARVSAAGISLIVLSFAPIAALEDPGVTALYGALVSVEMSLLAVSALLLARKRSVVPA
jgi:hypothetical protein